MLRKGIFKEIMHNLGLEVKFMLLTLETSIKKMKKEFLERAKIRGKARKEIIIIWVK